MKTYIIFHLLSSKLNAPKLTPSPNKQVAETIMMKAWVNSRYGLSEVLEFKAVPKPIPKGDEVIVKLHAVSINDWDWGLLRGKPFVNRMMAGLIKPSRVTILGSDIAGRVESIGNKVTDFKVGDAVFGDLCGLQWGGFAEYVRAPENTLTLKPENLSFEQAAAMPQAGLLALQGLTGKNSIKEGQKVLINGAGGGSGSFAIQIAKSFGAEITAVDTSTKFELMLSLGADHVVDYTQQDFTATGVRYDLILDMMGSHPLFDYFHSLTPTGRYVMVGGASGLIFKVITVGSIISLLSKKTMTILPHQPNYGMEKLIDLLKSNKVKPVIDKVYPFEKTAEAMAYFGSRLTKGKVIIKINDSEK